MYEAERIPKNGQAPREMGGYKFVQVGDAADFIRKALAEKVITMMPTGVQVVAQYETPTKSGGTLHVVDLITEWTLTDGESGESITIQSFGAGADSGDKYSGKASTSAMKYALLTGFLLSTGDDTEAARLPERGAFRDDDKIYRNEPKPRGSGLVSDTPFKEDEGGLIGTVEVGKARDSDFELRETPEGWALGFKLKSNGGGFKVLTRDELALQLLDAKDEVVGKRVTVYGRVRDETFTPNKPNARTVTYQVIDALRIKTEAGMLPVVIPKREQVEQAFIDGSVEGSPIDLDGEPIPVAEGQEALFDPAESARLDAEEAAKP
jgi:hypothetical protein